MAALKKLALIFISWTEISYNIELHVGVTEWGGGGSLMEWDPGSLEAWSKLCCVYSVIPDCNAALTDITVVK